MHQFSIKMKNKKYHNVGTVQNSNRKIVERDKIETRSTHIHNLSLPWFGDRHLIKQKGGGVKLSL